jgi:hypothetical protein
VDDSSKAAGRARQGTRILEDRKGHDPGAGHPFRKISARDPPLTRGRPLLEGQECRKSKCR